MWKYIVYKIRPIYLDILYGIAGGVSGIIIGLVIIYIVVKGLK